MLEPAFGDRPIIEIRAVEDSGCIMTGGVPTFGRARIWVIRSWTSWRAAASSVPGLKTRSMADRPGIDRELIRSTHGTPLSRSCSNGTVTSDSTSVADRPNDSVCTSTVVGVNSG